MARRQGKSCRPWLGVVALLGLSAASCGKPTDAVPPPLPGPIQDSQTDDTAQCDVTPLTEEEREYIWDLEHHGNLLVKYGFKPMADALSRADPAALLHLLAPDFSGQTLGKPRPVRMASEVADALRLADSGDRPAS